MDNKSKFVWDNDELKFVEGDQLAHGVKYASFAAEGCPFADCKYNAFCNGKCDHAQEEDAFAVACDIYDELVEAAEVSQASDVLALLKGEYQKLIPSEKANDAFVACVGVQLLQEVQMQFSVVLSDEEKKNFLA